jgi:hypothetical protein
MAQRLGKNERTDFLAGKKIISFLTKKEKWR